MLNFLKYCGILLKILIICNFCLFMLVSLHETNQNHYYNLVFIPE